MAPATAKTSDPQPHQPEPARPTVDVAHPQVSHSVDAALMKMVACTKLSPLKIMRDFVALSFGPGKPSLKDYTQLRLFDQAFWAGADRRAVIGQLKGVEIHQAVNFRHDWWGIFDNKIASVGYLSAYGFPVIPTLAVLAIGLRVDKKGVLRTEQELRDFLADDGNYPLFGKPTEGFQSLGSLALRRCHAADGVLETLDGRHVTIDAAVADILANYAQGYVFERFVAPHPDIEALCGERLPTARIVTINADGAPTVFRACWKIPAAGNAADNFWRGGNLLARIDVANGEVLRAVSGAGLDMVEHACHPDTGAALVGFRIPHWRAMVDTAVEAARLMQHVGLIGWDVASTNAGAVIVEMNERPDFFLPQFADARGVLDQEFIAFMAAQKRRSADNQARNRRELKDQ
jgi:hypothetical protein